MKIIGEIGTDKDTVKIEIDIDPEEYCFEGKTIEGIRKDIDWIFRERAFEEITMSYTVEYTGNDDYRLLSKKEIERIFG